MAMWASRHVVPSTARNSGCHQLALKSPVITVGPSAETVASFSRSASQSPWCTVGLCVWITMTRMLRPGACTSTTTVWCLVRIVE